MCSGDQEIISPFSLSISIILKLCIMYSNNVLSFLMMNMNIGVQINVPYSAPFY